MAKAETVVVQKDILLILTESEAKLIRGMLSKLPVFPKVYGDEVNSLRLALDAQGITVMSYEVGLEGNLYFEADRVEKDPLL